MEKTLVTVDVYGKLALFTNPFFKLDRVTYDIITPSAARGILNAIYCKPVEFYYEIKSLEVMNPIKYLDVKRNEMKSGRISNRNLVDGIIRDEDNTQKNSRFLKDVYYRINAYIVKRNDFKGKLISLKEQFERRVAAGKCFYQPFLGCKECVAYFEAPNPDKHPLRESRDFGVSMYDIFDIRNNVPLDKKNTEDVLRFTFYHANMKNGVINVPSYDDILRGVFDA